MQTHEIKRAQQLVIKALRPMLEINPEDAQKIVEAEIKAKQAQYELRSCVESVAHQIFKHLHR